MKRALWLAVSLLICLVGLQAASPDSSSNRPQYTSDHRLLRPDNYREWIFLSSGLGMTYSAEAGGPPMFTNVFVPRWAYREFLKTGKWPDKSIFVVEERNSDSKASINTAGHFQTDFEGFGVEVKDSSAPELWSYYNFGADTKAAKVNPKPACWQCHEDHAAVEHSFVQFYPTLKPVAKKFGTYNQDREKVNSSP